MTSPKCARLSGTLYFVETWRLKSRDNFPRLRFSNLKLWGTELRIALQMWVQAAACGHQNWAEEDCPPPFLQISKTTGPVIFPQVPVHSSAMAWDETDARMGNRAYFLLFTGRKSLCMGSTGCLAYSGLKPCSVWLANQYSWALHGDRWQPQCLPQLQ